jgi:hypothetical protein
MWREKNLAKFRPEDLEISFPPAFGKKLGPTFPKAFASPPTLPFFGFSPSFFSSMHTWIV